MTTMKLTKTYPLMTTLGVNLIMNLLISIVNLIILP